MIQYQDVDNAPYHLKQIAYYTKQIVDTNVPNAVDPLIPLCYGELARAHGREGTQFTVDEWSRVAMGYNPFVEDWHLHPIRGNAAKLDEDLKPLPVSEERKKKDRDSLEFVLSSDKSISVWWAAQDNETQDRYMHGVNNIMRDVVLPLVEMHCMYEENNKKLFANGAAFITWFNHIESRGVDPFLHTHFNIKNSVQDEQGKYRALVTDSITKNYQLIDAAYQMAHANMLRTEFGLALDKTFTKQDEFNEHKKAEQKNVFTFRVSGISDGLCKEYSKRSDEIKAELKKKGLSGDSYEAASIAQVSTRSQKTELNSDELRQQWREELSLKHNFTEDVTKVLCTQALDSSVTDPKLLPSDDELIENFHAHLGEVKFTESQFKSHMLKQFMLCMSVDECERKAEALFSKYSKVCIEHGKDNLYEQVAECTNTHERRALQHHLALSATFTSTLYENMEQRTFQAFESRKSETRHVIDKTLVLKALDDFQVKHSTSTRAFNFTAGQLNAAITTLTEPGAVDSIIGMAGTGKTAVVKAMKEIYEKQGYRVIGTATGNKATKGLLNDSGIKEGANTTALLMKLKPNGDKPPALTLTERDVVILDEAGMTSGAEICKLAAEINKAGAKFVLLGDADQLQAVGPSGLYRHVAAKFTTSTISEIQRQSEQWQRELVSDAAAGRNFEAFLTLFEQNRIKVFDTDKERLQAIADHYLADQSSANRKFVLANLNDDAQLINEAIQAKQLQTGELSRAMGVAEVEYADGRVTKFHVGERIVFTKKVQNDDPNARNEASNAECGFVRRIEHRKGQLRAVTIELDNGKMLTLGPQKCRSIALANCLTTYKSQGATVDNSYIFLGNKLNNLHSAYVQLSRHKENTMLFLSREQVNKMAESERLAEAAPAQKSWANDLIARDLAAKVIDEAKAMALRQDCQTFQGCREYLNSHSEAYKADATVPRQKLMQTQVIRDFVSIIEACGKRNHKKSTMDYQILDRSHNDMLSELRQSMRAKAHTKSQTPQPPAATTQALPIIEPSIQPVMPVQKQKGMSLTL